MPPGRNGWFERRMLSEGALRERDVLLEAGIEHGDALSKRRPVNAYRAQENYSIEGDLVREGEIAKPDRRVDRVEAHGSGVHLPANGSIAE